MKLIVILSTINIIASGQICQAPKEYADKGDVFHLNVHRGKLVQFQTPGGPPIKPVKPYSIRKLKKLMKKCKIRGSSKLADGEYVAYGRVQKNKFEPLIFPQLVQLDQISGNEMCGVHLSKCPTVAPVALKMDKAKGTKHKRAV